MTFLCVIVGGCGIASIPQRNVRNIRAPYLVDGRYLKTAEQIRIDLVLRMGLARRGAGSLAFQPHLAHQTHHSLTVDRISLAFEPDSHPPAPIERCLDILPVYGLHQFFVSLTLPAGQQ